MLGAKPFLKADIKPFGITEIEMLPLVWIIQSPFLIDKGDFGGLWDKKEPSSVLTLRGEKITKNIPLNILFFGD